MWHDGWFVASIWIFLRCLIECREEYRYNIEAVDCLIRSGLVSMPQYDLHMAQSMENGLNYMAVAFSMQLVQRFCIDEKHEQASEVRDQQYSADTMATGLSFKSDFLNTVDTLARIAQQSRQVPDG